MVCSMNSNVGIVFPKTPRVVLADDHAKFHEYIDSKKSPATQKNVSQNLHYGFNFIHTHYPKINSVLQITPEQLKDYFIHIEARPLRKTVKRKYRTNLKAFINYLLGDLRAYNKKLPFNYDYVFSDEFHKFKDSSGKIERDAVSVTEIYEILAFYENRSMRDFVLIGILAYSGCRVGGLCALKITDIDLENRTFETQEKPTSGSTGWNRYFYPKKFQVHLESYLIELKMCHPTRELLFPIKPKSVRQILSNYPNRHVNPHLFRDAINTHWVENGLLDAGIRASLLNQKPSGINAGHYLKTYTQNDKSGKNRLELYDKYFPY